MSLEALASLWISIVLLMSVEGLHRLNNESIEKNLKKYERSYSWKMKN